jgi:alkylhydroperoxidase family enzyme
MRPVPYKPVDLSEPKELVASIRARRGGVLLNLDRMLLHSIPLADGWNGFLRRIRNELTVEPKLRELAICVVAVWNRAEYEFHHHAPELLKAGASPAQVEALRTLETAENLAALFDPTELAVIQLATEMTRDIQVSDATFAAVSTALQDNQQTVELVAIIAAYNMVSRFLVALKVELE